MRALPVHLDTLPRPVGRLTLCDGYGMAYYSDVFSIRAEIAAAEAVFVFSRLEGIWPQPLFVGLIGAVPVQLDRHPMRARAMALGGVHLILHKPEPDDPVKAPDAAERMIAWYRPVLNGAPVQHRLQQAAGSARETGTSALPTGRRAEFRL
ncbi:MAG: hypothetical protein ACFBSD_05195 [Paracoccaceae bacterium]